MQPLTKTREANTSATHTTSIHVGNENDALHSLPMRVNQKRNKTEFAVNNNDATAMVEDDQDQPHGSKHNDRSAAIRSKSRTKS